MPINPATFGGLAMSISRTRPRVRFGRRSNGMLMTPEEFDAAENFDENYRYELVRGVLIVCPPPGEGQRDPNGELDYLLRRYKEDHPRGAVLDKTLAEQYVHLPDSRRLADRVIWAGLGRVPDPAADVPTIVIEIVSKRKRDRTRDYEEKRREHLALGVAESWVIDRFQRRMTVFRRPPAEPAEILVPADGTYRTPILPGFELPLARLLAVADDWAKPKPEIRRPRPGEEPGR